MVGLESGRELPVSPGQLIAEKYRVEHVLGVGGMGVVVAATHLHLHQPVAIKFMLPEAAADPESVARFLREARNAVQLKSEHVARVLDVATLENGSPFIVMEFLDGMTADELLESGHVLTIGEAVEYTIQVCEAVAEAHARGIIHRDLKLANLFMTSSADKRALVKVIDFGLSRPVDRDSKRITKDMALMGTPAYMSPEQLRSADDIDTRADLWALGVVLFELLTGQVPFTGATSPEVCSQVLTGAPLDPRRIRPEIPDRLAAIIARCLQKDRELRYATVTELAEALDPFVPEGGTRAGDRIRRVQSENVMAPSFKSSGYQEIPSKRTGLSWGADGMLGPKPSYRGWIILTVIVTVLAIGALTVAIRMMRSSAQRAVIVANEGPPQPAVDSSSSAAVASPPTSATSTADLADPATVGSAGQRAKQPRSPNAGAPPPRPRPPTPKKGDILDSR
jgi:serine/threonine-protein kinase